MAGLKVVSVKTHDDGCLNLHDLKEKAEKHRENLAAFMVSFPTVLILSCYNYGYDSDYLPIYLWCI